MASYYKNRPTTAVSQAGVAPTLSNPALSEYDKHRLALLSDDTEEGWASELRRYLSQVQHDVEKYTDIVEWWQVGFVTYIK
jgi:hypothetical protein